MVHQTKSGKEEEEEEEEGGEEDAVDADAEEGPEEEEDGSSTKIINYLTKSYTYKTEITNIYNEFRSKNERADKIHNTTMVTKQKVDEKWEAAKERIKGALSMFGIEGAFVFLDAMAKKSFWLRHTFKVFGTTILPVLAIISLIIWAYRASANPLQKILKWLSKEFDLKLPAEEEEGV